MKAELPDYRERIYTPTVTLSLFMSQVLSSDGSCQNAVNAYVTGRVLNGLDACSTGTGAYCKARLNLPLELVKNVAREAGQVITDQVPDTWQWRGQRILLLDGTTITMPDTEANQIDYPQQSSQKPGLGFPIARMVALICLSSGVVLDAAMGPCKGKGASEHALFRKLLDTLKPGDMVLADRYYASYWLIAELMSRNVDVVFQQHAVRKVDFRKGKRLGARDHVVEWRKPPGRPKWMKQERYDDYPQAFKIRETKSGGKVLVTTFLSAGNVSKKELSDLFIQRWHVELDLRNIKTTLGMETLSCMTPEMNEKEMWSYFLGYNLIRLLMCEAADVADLVPRQISFKHTLQLWNSWSLVVWWAEEEKQINMLYVLIAQQRVGDRPGRIEPRAVKRRPKPYPRLMKPREEAREDVRKYGHPKKIR